MKREQIILFGAGNIGKVCAKLLRFDKEILFFIDNDFKKWGGNSNYPVYPVDRAKGFPDALVVICTYHFPSAVMQLESMGIHKYVYFEDLYGWQMDVPSIQIVKQNLPKKQDLPRELGPYTWKIIINNSMNHMRWHYKHSDFKNLFTEGKKYLDMGCGCGTSLFHALLLGIDGTGIDCCRWKLDFCKQKVEDFSFPNEWKNRFLFGHGENLPFDDNIFDIVTSWYVLEHVMDWKACIHEMVRVTKHGGVIILNAPDYRNTYEEHYGLDNGISIIDHQDEWKQYLLSRNETLDLFNTLNFISKDLIIEELGKLPVKIIDREGDNIIVDRNTEDGKMRIHRRIDLIVYVY